MAIAEPLKNTVFLDAESEDWNQKSYRCLVGLIHEEDGTVSAIVLNLPGAGSCGDTEEEALKNVREAIQGVIESYIEAGEKIPWKDPASCSMPERATQKWIVVNA